MFRATLKSLLGRKLRLTLSALAVILGVMFVAGSFVLTDTLGRSFENMFDSAYAHTDVVVTSQMKDGQPVKPLTDSDLAQVRAMTAQVGRAEGVVQAEGARVVGKDGKVVTTVGPPRIGANWIDGVGGAQIREGRAPQADDEVVLNVALAREAGFHVGDTVDILTTQPRKSFTLVGTFGYAGGLDGRGGVLEARFTKAAAQQLMLNQPGAYTYFDVKAAPGQTPQAVRDALRTKLGSGYQVKTGAEMAKAIADQFTSVLDGLNKVLLGFGGVALFVGIFLILNIFSITVAQRTKELALARALGASRKQMIGSVLAEALIVGLIGAVFGLGAGIGVGWLLSNVAANMASLPLAPIAVPLSAIIASVLVGVVITMIAALLPALRASRVPPIAALQEVATPDRPLTRLTVSGAAVTASGAALMAYGLTGDGHLWPMLGGVMLAFVGVALLSPALGRPVVAMLGRLFSWSVPGKLGRLNSGRNPRRTAITAAALMIGIALITGASTILHSGDVSLRGSLDRDVKADLLVSGQDSPDVMPDFAAEKVDQMRRIPGVTTVTSQVFSGALITESGGDTERRGVEILDDVAGLAQQYSLHTVAGSMTTPGANEVVVDSDTANSRHLSVGDTVKVEMDRNPAADYRIIGVYQTNDFYSEYLFGPTALAGLRNQQPQMATITLAPGTDATAVKKQVAALVTDDPEVTVVTRAEYLDEVSGQLGTLLTMVTVLLGLAIIIAVLGVIITLWLSVLERTRELGLLRAIGLGRSATMRMITVEAVVITLFGTLLGLGTGVGMGAAVVRSLRGDGITSFAVPWSQLATYLAAGALVGVIAAVLPSIKAARTNVLRAIAYE